uniref:(northern house mosquito) hypothetical protein n=2 Tax=Culex pipiens TaxID=7175 RepID=A0A8D8KAP2_CULPI
MDYDAFLKLKEQFGDGDLAVLMHLAKMLQTPSAPEDPPVTPAIPHLAASRYRLNALDTTSDGQNADSDELLRDPPVLASEEKQPDEQTPSGGSTGRFGSTPGSASGGPTPVQSVTPGGSSARFHQEPSGSTPGSASGGPTPVQSVTPGGSSARFHQEPAGSTPGSASGGPTPVQSVTPGGPGGSKLGTSSSANPDSTNDPSQSECASTKLAFFKFLQSKKLESYFNLLNSHKITTLEEFSSLDESDIDSFCTVLLDKVEFRKILKETKATSSEESDEFLAKLTQKPGGFGTWLESQTLALDIIEYHKIAGTITNSQRNVIVEIVQSAAKRRGIKFNDLFYRKMATAIATTFGDDERYYYQPSYKTVDGKRVAPSGKLVKRKGSALEKLSKKMKANEMTGKATGPIENLNGQAAARDWLVRGRTPKEMVIDQWKNCFELRKQDISTAASLNEILEMYPIIKHPIGGNLIISDFDVMYPGATNSFFLNFHKLHDVLKPFLKTAHKSDKNDTRYRMYKQAPDDSSLRDLLLCYFLPLIIQTDYKIKGSNWRPSVTDAQKYFLMEIVTAGELNTGINKLTKELASASKKTPLQPHIAVVGKLENAAFKVIFGGSQYAVESVQHAIALCVQICVVLDLEYSFETFPVWCFLQQYLFQIPLQIAVPKSCDKLLKALAKA